jgi:hypothetical protein
MAELKRAAVAGNMVPAVQYRGYLFAESHREHQAVKRVTRMHLRALTADLTADLYLKAAPAWVHRQMRQRHDQMLRLDEEQADGHDPRQRVIPLVHSWGPDFGAGLLMPKS